MTPTIDDIEAALPHVPAGLHCGDLTEADERRAFAVTVHEIVVRASQTVPGSPESAEQGSSGTQVQGNQDERNKGVSSWRARVSWNVDSIDLLSPWPPPKPGTHESDLSVRGVVFCKVPGDTPPAYDRAMRWSRENAR